MKWVRTYYKDPETMLASGHSFVWDGEGHNDIAFFIDGYDYYDALCLATDNTVFIEWDIAVDREDRNLFESYCRAEPDRIHVAPYKHHWFKNADTEFSYLCRRDLDNFSQPGDPSCMLFGFGLTYIPLELIRQFVEDLNTQPPFTYEIPYELHLTKPGEYRHVQGYLDANQIVTDAQFSCWHWGKYHRPVPLHWDIRPIHLGYDMRQL